MGGESDGSLNAVGSYTYSTPPPDDDFAREKGCSAKAYIARRRAILGAAPRPHRVAFAGTPRKLGVVRNRHTPLAKRQCRATQ
mmetsp:Transcript_55641/g.153584  ORF Transcript_55641/g.153584 Transcript_55641/m.153584 type:complete len:83 (-) Transcript_55641:43-291(-)